MPRNSNDILSIVRERYLDLQNSDGKLLDDYLKELQKRLNRGWRQAELTAPISERLFKQAGSVAEYMADGIPTNDPANPTHELNRILEIMREELLKVLPEIHHLLPHPPERGRSPSW